MGSKRMMAAAALVLCVMAFYTSPAVQRKAAAPLTIPTAAPGSAAQAEPLANTDFLRFHVIANSDSKDDQDLKLRVRDGLLEEINRDLTVHTMTLAEPTEGKVALTQEQVRQYVSEHLEEIEEKGERIVRTLGKTYEVTAQLEVCNIPEKTYDNVTFPEGQYEALNVTIGSGGGQNWWCVLFPPLCLVGAEPLSAGGVEDEAAVPVALQIPSKYDPLIRAAEEGARTDQPVKLELRFKTLELIDSLSSNY